MFQIKNYLQIIFIVLLMAGAIFIWEKVSSIKQFFTNETKITQNIVLKEVVAMGKMELVNFQFRDVVESEIQKALLPNAKVLLVISGQSVGCIDLTKIKQQDIDLKGDSLKIKLPLPEICVNKIDHSQSKVYDMSLFSLLDQSQLIDEAYKKAELQIKDSAMQMGIIEQTKQNADKILRPMFEKISGKKVGFYY
jgi:ABC-type phosphate transport system auxiliary subunit